MLDEQILSTLHANQACYARANDNKTRSRASYLISEVVDGSRAPHDFAVFRWLPEHKLPPCLEKLHPRTQTTNARGSQHDDSDGSRKDDNNGDRQMVLRTLSHQVFRSES